MPRCRVPKTVPVKGHWRVVKGRRRKKRAGRARPAKAHWVASDEYGHSCGHVHGSATAASSCAKKQRAAERARRARLTRKQVRKDRLRHWSVEYVKA